MIDTKKFKGLDDCEYKKQTQENWGKEPCGAVRIKKELVPFTKEYFDDLEQVKEKAEPWKLEQLKKLSVKNKKVLEIGFGMGTDHLNLAREGGIMHGIDITPGNKEITEKRMKLYGYQSELLIGDAENLPYEDNTFDLVYSFGVIHHTPNMEKTVKEIHRVLKPGGQCFVGVYNKNSVFFWWSLLTYHYLFERQFLKYTIKQRLSLIEYPNNNVNLVVKLSTKKDLKKIFADFSKFRIKSTQVLESEVECGELIGEERLRKLFPNGGWYLLVRAEK